MADDAVAYLRISADPDDERLGVTRQNTVARQLAERFGVTLDATRIYMDNDVSATKIRSPISDWHACLKDIRERRPAYLFGLKMERLGRRMGDLEGLEELCKATGTVVWTLDEGEVFRNPAWPFLAAQAKTEGINTSKRVQWAQDARRSAGKDGNGGMPPFGYTGKDKDVVVPSQAAELRRMARWIISGKSASSLAKDLNERGIVKPQGKAWTVHTVLRMLRNPRYAGKLVHKGQIIGDAAWPAIFDPETWELLQHRLKQTAKPRGGGVAKALLAGVARCGRCDGRLTAATARGYKVYRCPGCYAVTRKMSLIDEYVTERVRGMARQEQQDTEGVELDEAVDAAQTENNRLELEIAYLREQYLEGRVDAEDFYPTLDGLRRKLRQSEDEWRRGLADLAALADDEDAETGWGRWDTEQRRAFIASKVAAVVVYPGKYRGNDARVLHDDEIKIIPKKQKSPGTQE